MYIIYIYIHKYLCACVIENVKFIAEIDFPRNINQKELLGKSDIRLQW